MSKFSKGEWYVDSASVLRCDDEYDRSIAWLITSPSTKELDEANARLIAFAPEMYDELYEALQLLKGKSSYESDEFAIQAKSIEELFARIDGEEAEA